MRVLIHDLDKQALINLYPKINEDIKVISMEKEINKCIGCFGCWIKTPASCVIKDDYGNLGKLFSQSDELIIISKIRYGGFSPFVKTVLDRNIGYILPYFTIRNNEMHHKSRYKKRMKLSVLGYGDDVTQKERKTLVGYVTAIGLNFNTLEPSVSFVNSLSDLNKLREVL